MNKITLALLRVRWQHLGNIDLGRCNTRRKHRNNKTNNLMAIMGLETTVDVGSKIDLGKNFGGFLSQ